MTRDQDPAASGRRLRRVPGARMVAHSTHKRKRSAIRADHARSHRLGRLHASLYTWSEESREELKEAIPRHPFNFALQVIAPHTTEDHDVVRALRDAVKDAGPGPCIAQVSLSLFLEPRFVAQYVRTGSLYALSTTCLDTQDTVCLDGRGMLVLSLLKDTYQQLGLVGRPCRFAHGASGRMGDRKSGPVSRYMVELPLCDPSFVPGKRGYERALRCLREWDQRRSAAGTASHTHGTPATWSMLLVWTPPASPNAQRPRVWAPVEYDALRSVRHLSPDVCLDIHSDVWVPASVDICQDTMQDMWSSLHAHLEWLGLAMWPSPRLRTYDRCDHRIAMYEPPAPSSPSSFVQMTVRGFLTPMLLVRVLECVWASSLPWASLTVSGFADAPIAWASKYPGVGLALGSATALPEGMHDGLNAAQRARKVRRKSHTRRGESEHGFFQTGENGWTILLSPPSRKREGAVALIESVELDTHM